MFSKRHYLFLAHVLRALRTAYPNGQLSHALVVGTFARAFLDHDHRFDPVKFRAACGEET